MDPSILSYLCKKEFRVLTYNTHLFQGSLEVEALDFINDKLGSLASKIHLPKIVYRDAARVSAIMENIRKLSPDIVCLQEVWGEETRSMIKTNLKDMYPFSYTADPQELNEGDASDVVKILVNSLVKDDQEDARKQLADHLFAFLKSIPFASATAAGMVRGRVVTDGLVVLSKTALTNCEYIRYDRVSIHDPEDRLGRKGYVTFQIADPVPLAMGTTHMPTTPASIYELIKDPDNSRVNNLLKESPTSSDAIFLGDFNLHYFTYEERDELVKCVRAANPDAEDVVARLSLDESYTCWAENGLGKALSDNCTKPTGALTARDRIDYVYFAPATDSSKRRLDLANARATVIKNWTMSDGCVGDLDLSDHNPVLVTFPIIGG